MSYSLDVGENGTVVLPTEVREVLGLKCGDKIDLIVDGKKAIMLPANRDNPFDKWVGALGGSFSSIEEINRWVADLREEDPAD